MLQANPNLSPFDIRNIMQEQATYRQCHYMGANEPCAEDLIQKNRQNKVYGHGHVNALESVLEAAEYNQQWSFNKNITRPLTNQLNENGNVVFRELAINSSIDFINSPSSTFRLCYPKQ